MIPAHNWPLDNIVRHETTCKYHDWHIHLFYVTISQSHYIHDDIVNWKHFPCYWPFVQKIHQSPVNAPQKGQWHGALMFSLICIWTNSWLNNRDASDLRRHYAHYNVTVIRLLPNCYDPHIRQLIGMLRVSLQEGIFLKCTKMLKPSPPPVKWYFMTSDCMEAVLWANQKLGLKILVLLTRILTGNPFL